MLLHSNLSTNGTSLAVLIYFNYSTGEVLLQMFEWEKGQLKDYVHELKRIIYY